MSTLLLFRTTFFNHLDKIRFKILCGDASPGSLSLSRSVRPHRRKYNGYSCETNFIDGKYIQVKDPYNLYRTPTHSEISNTMQINLQHTQAFRDFGMCACVREL